jgi:hypothetical protein
LIKKTLNVKYKGVNHHIVSYYNLEDVKSCKYTRPQFDLNLHGCTPRAELMNNNYKAGLQSEDMDPFQEYSQPLEASIPGITNGLPMAAPRSPAMSSHPLQQTTVTPLPMRWPSGYSVHHASTYPYPQQPGLNFHTEDYYPNMPTTSDPGAVLDTNPSPTSLDANSSYLFQNAGQSNMYHPSPIVTSSPIPHQWVVGDFSNDFKDPAPKRRQTTGSSIAMHSYNGGFMGGFDASHGLSFLPDNQHQQQSVSSVY